MAGVTGSSYPAPGELCRRHEVSRWRRPGRDGAGPPGAGAAGRRGDDRGRGQRPGGREAVPGLADVGEPVAAGAGCGRPGCAGFQGGGRSEVQAHPGAGRRAGGGPGRGPCGVRLCRSVLDAGPGRRAGLAADRGAWLCWEDESGQGLRPPKGRTWGRRGRTPVVTVTGGHDTRVSLAALIAVRPGRRPRLIYRTHRARHADKRKGFTETDYARLLDAAHQQLNGPIVLVWDNLNTHTSGAMAALIAARDWLTVYRLPPYASELNPVEPVWSNLKRSLANLTRHDIDQLTALVKSRLRRMQYRPGLLEGFLAKPGLDLTPLR